MHLDARRGPGKEFSEEEVRQAFQAIRQLVKGYPGRQGSNNWAVDGHFTETGRSLIANDPHLGFDFLGSPFPLHLNSKDRGGTYNVAGFVYPGTPGITLGFNEKLMWTSTTSFGDVMDIWELEEEGGGIVVGDKVVGARDRTEQFIIRGPGDPAGQGTTEEIGFRDVSG